MWLILKSELKAWAGLKDITPSVEPIHTMPFKSSVKHMTLVQVNGCPSWSVNWAYCTCWGRDDDNSPLLFHKTMGISKSPSEKILMS